eukprot:5953942-Prymnesium_polylepis.1
MLIARVHDLQARAGNSIHVTVTLVEENEGEGTVSPQDGPAPSLEMSPSPAPAAPAATAPAAPAAPATAPAAPAPATVPAVTAPAAPSPATPPQPQSDSDIARPLGASMPPTGTAAAQQAAILDAACQLREEVLARRPHREVRPAAGEKNGVCVNREAGGHLCLSMLGHPSAAAEIVFDINFYGNWKADISLRISGLGTGLLPLLALAREPDLVPDYLPRQAGLPYLERLEMVKEWAPNDWAYHCFVCPFGPLPGADDVHNLTFFDVMDSRDDARLVAYMISPPEGESVFRGWDVPQVTASWRRKRNYVLGATTIVRPSSAKVIELEKPSARPGRCASPGCDFAVHSCLSLGGGRYCCQRCHEKGSGKHGSSCERVRYCEPVANGGDGGEVASTEHAWQIAKYGTVDLEASPARRSSPQPPAAATGGAHCDRGSARCSRDPKARRAVTLAIRIRRGTGVPQPADADPHLLDPAHVRAVAHAALHPAHLPVLDAPQRAIRPDALRAAGARGPARLLSAGGRAAQRA